MIVDTPSFVILFCVSAIAPPAIVVRLFVQKSEAVGISIVQEFREPFSFFREESRRLSVTDRVVDVDCFVTDVIVA
jgi:hypothetical protein